MRSNPDDGSRRPACRKSRYWARQRASARCWVVSLIIGSVTVMFQRYTETARRVIFFARYEASQFGSPYIETEHLLLGILREAPEISEDLALGPDTAIGIRRRIEASVVPGPKEPIGIDLPLSHAAKIALARAAEE